MLGHLEFPQKHSQILSEGPAAGGRPPGPSDGRLGREQGQRRGRGSWGGSRGLGPGGGEGGGKGQEAARAGARARRHGAGSFVHDMSYLPTICAMHAICLDVALLKLL